MNYLQKSAVALSSLALSASAFAVEDPNVQAATDKITGAFASATTMATTVGLGLIGLAVLGFIFRAARRGGSGKN
jgi:hypothetical protein